jgi:phage-related protein
VSATSERPSPKPLVWVGSSRADLVGFPESVRREFGYALYLAQVGEKSPDAKPLRGFGGAGVLEVVARYPGSTYRAVYTIKFPKAVFVLHAFQKKSKKRVATPRPDIDLIQRRLKIAAKEYRESHESQKP